MKIKYLFSSIKYYFSFSSGARINLHSQFLELAQLTSFSTTLIFTISRKVNLFSPRALYKMDG